MKTIVHVKLPFFCRLETISKFKLKECELWTVNSRNEEDEEVRDQTDFILTKG